MYDLKLHNSEEIKLISDDVVIYTPKEEIHVTGIITNQRLLILDYPSGIHNSAEDLRITGRMTYIRKKEVIGEIILTDIKALKKEKDYYKIELNNKEYININNDAIIEYLKKL